MIFCVLIVGLMLMVIIYGLILNPSFWQGYRNSKFIDETLDNLRQDKVNKNKTDNEKALDEYLNSILSKKAIEEKEK